jgi:DNA invertase Pin-like site-specific DNA recombinase
MSVENHSRITGYARVSTTEQYLQDLDGQRHRLKRARTIRIFDDIIGGRTLERPGMARLLDYARPGDVLCVVWFDRPGRSNREQLETVEMLKQRGIAIMPLDGIHATAEAH